MERFDVVESRSFRGLVTRSAATIGVVPTRRSPTDLFHFVERGRASFIHREASDRARGESEAPHGDIEQAVSGVESSSLQERMRLIEREIDVLRNEKDAFEERITGLQQENDALLDREQERSQDAAASSSGVPDEAFLGVLNAEEGCHHKHRVPLPTVPVHKKTCTGKTHVCDKKQFQRQTQRF